VHTPALQTSFWVHFDPSASHDEPSDLAGYVQVPLVASQVPGPVWHWSGALQVMATPAVQTPPLQTSVWVQLLLSLQLVLSGLAGLEHVPVVGSHVPAT
jgi:hypothetical protein